MATRTSLCRMDKSGYRKDAKTGWVTGPVFTTRPGAYPYQRADGSTVIELRPEDEVFKPESLASFENKPVTNSHPPVLLNSKNTKQYQVGNLFGPHKRADDGEHAETWIQITDDTAIADVDAGKEQVSLGYECDIEEKPGVHPKYGRYDAIQRNIRGNHLAIEWRGRMGPGARIRKDGEAAPGESVSRFDAWEVDDDPPPNDSPTLPDPAPTTPKKDSQEGVQRPMATYRIDNQDHEVSDLVKLALEHKERHDAKALSEAEQKAKDAEDEAKKAKDAAAKVKTDADAEIGELKAKLDTATETITSLQAVDLDARLDSLQSLRDKALPILGKDYVFKGKSEGQIKLDAVQKAYPAFKADSIPEAQRPAYIDARFDAATEAQVSSGGADPVLAAYDRAAAPRNDADYWNEPA